MTETAPATMNNANDTLNTAIANCTNERDSLFVFVPPFLGQPL